MNTNGVTERLIAEDRDILALIGITLISVQVTERNFGFCINFVFRSGPVITLDGIDDLEEDARRKTLGQLIQSFRKAIAVPPSFDDELESFLKNRNRFVHRMRHESELNMDQPQGRQNLWSFLVRLCDQMNSLNQVFLGFLSTFAAELRMSSFSKETELGDTLGKFSESSDWKLVIQRTIAK